MNNTAIVNRVVNNRVYLMHIKDYGDKEGTERKFWRVENREFEANNPKKLKLKKGDGVEFSIPETQTIFASFVILILPLIIFFLTFLGLGALGVNSEKVKALISIPILFISFFITKALKKAGIKETLPTILSIVSRDELKKHKSKCKECGSCTACD